MVVRKNVSKFKALLITVYQMFKTIQHLATNYSFLSFRNLNFLNI